ncbi:50S ribosomal protein L35 [Candidatus Microgenomates bacterium]|nr:50S ribosomal protein L35 [Candidatus Microgenomates bacterium]
MKKTKVKKKSKKLVTTRIKVTKNGKVLRRRAFKRHLNAGKSKKRLRRLSRMVEVKKPMAKRLRKFLGKVRRTKGKVEYVKK